MNNEENLDQAAINELLATANKELSGLDVQGPEIPAPEEPAVTEEVAATEEPIAPIATPAVARFRKIFSSFPLKRIIDYLTQKKYLLFIILIALAMVFGAFFGYKKLVHTSLAQTPLETIIHQGITFEEKNFVIYAGRGDKVIVNAFLAAGMPVDVVRTTDGWSPLMAASFFKKTEIVQLLLEKEASVNLQDLYGKTPLMQASAMGAEDIVVMLLAYGADPNIQDKNHRTALNEAYSKKQAKIAEILKEAGGTIPLPPKVLKKPPLSPTGELPILNTEQTLLSVGKAGPIQVGMPLSEIQKIYPTLTVTEKYVDGRKKKVARIYISDQQIPSLELELSSGATKLVSTISTNDEQFSTDKSITIKSTVGDIRNKYSTLEFRVIDNSLFLAVKSMRMLFEIDVTSEKAITEWLTSNDTNSVPADTKIKSIVLY